MILLTVREGGPGRGRAVEVPEDLLQKHMACTIFYPKSLLSSATEQGAPTSLEKAPSPRCTGESTTANLAR